jgi:glyoxylase-like metal-dependent hydrolase (beta-lactamase superfamily II)
MTAIRQLEQLGFDPRDVEHIVLSHLDFDHAGCSAQSFLSRRVVLPRPRSAPSKDFTATPASCS